MEFFLGKNRKFIIAGENNDELADLVKRFYKSDFKEQISEDVLNAIRKVDRKQFLLDIKVDSEMKSDLDNYNSDHPSVLAYGLIAVDIGYGQTCSHPTMVARIAQHLELEKGMHVFEIGTGCFYSAAVILNLIGEDGYLVTIEYLKRLANLGKRNAIKYLRLGEEELEKRALLLHGDGKKGYPEKAPYDRIVATCGVKDIETFDRNKLEKQLVPDGKIMIPEEDGGLYLFHYHNGRLGDREYLGEVRFVKMK